jgi:hypothetical protein
VLWEIRHRRLSSLDQSSKEHIGISFVKKKTKPFQTTSLITSLFVLKRTDEETIYNYQNCFSIIDKV